MEREKNISEKFKDEGFKLLSESKYIFLRKKLKITVYSGSTNFCLFTLLHNDTLWTNQGLLQTTLGNHTKITLLSTSCRCLRLYLSCYQNFNINCRNWPDSMDIIFHPLAQPNVLCNNMFQCLGDTTTRNLWQWWHFQYNGWQ